FAHEAHLESSRPVGLPCSPVPLDDRAMTGLMGEVRSSMLPSTGVRCPCSQRVIPMTGQRRELIVMEPRLAVCKLAEDDEVPGWAVGAGFFSITRTADELSVVCPEELVPEGVKVERGWRALRVAGVIDFSVVGVLAELTAPLARAGVGVFAISTFNTDYLL